ncbi:hypothetical protein [Streptomyces sp. NPDC014623]|uniref:hypothetical protein n=1 Tax=Streptomyces sp. NPDC014623 TaxID=3364875 RepID=UPI003702155B
MAITATAAAVESSASVTLTLTGLPLGYLLRVRRVLASTGARTPVRGPAGLLDGATTITSAFMVLEDYEAPLGVEVSYLIEATSGSTVQSYRTDAVTVPHADPDMAWLKDPANPQRNVQIMVQRPPDWQRPIEQAKHRVAGRRNAVILWDVRGGREGDLTVFTRTDAEREVLGRLLDSGNVLLWQATPGMGVDDTYVSVGPSAEPRIAPDARDPWRSWTLPLVEQDMPTTIGVNGSGNRTWADVVAEFDTCTDVMDTYATCEDLLLDWRR